MKCCMANGTSERRILFAAGLFLVLFTAFLYQAKFAAAGNVSTTRKESNVDSISTGGAITETPPAQTETPPLPVLSTPPDVDSSSLPPTETPEPVKEGWGKENGKKYYVYSDGSYAQGVVKIKKTIYAFTVRQDSGKPGFLKKGIKTRVCELNGKWYLVNKNGKIVKGWYLKKNKLYYFHGKLGCAVTNKSVDGITFNRSGYAVNDPNSAVKISAMKILNSITSSKDSKSQKLYKAFCYMVKKSKWSYAMKYPNLSDKLWTRKLGSNMLKTHSGNCYGFACAFAALAEEIGYHPQVVCGRIRGSRDGARDGLTRHAIVRISGKYYDPEGWWKGFAHIYKSSRCPLAQVNKIVAF